MKRPDDQVRLQHMLEAADKTVRLAKGRQRADLETDETLVLALTRLLEIIGEAANGVSAALRDANPKIPWKQIIGARHHFIHGYFDVDHDIIWQILQTDLPPLITDLKKLIKQ